MPSVQTAANLDVSNSGQRYVHCPCHHTTRKPQTPHVFEEKLTPTSPRVINDPIDFNTVHLITLITPTAAIATVIREGEERVVHTAFVLLLTSLLCFECNGIPIGGYSEFLLQLMFLLAHIRWFISPIFNAVDYLFQWDVPVLNAVSSCNVEKQLVRELIPVVRYDDVAKVDGVYAAMGECAVCLCDFEGCDEVRRLSNCRHVFHRCCLDRWMEHDRSTCPLCRSQLYREDVMLLGH